MKPKPGSFRLRRLRKDRRRRQPNLAAGVEMAAGCGLRALRQYSGALVPRTAA
jgi:hypothetical protein